MSLLDGLKQSMINPLYDSIMESEMDDEFDFETALEEAVDKQIELSDSDIRAILDDENPDNIVADFTDKDESLNKIAKDTVNEDLATLESMLDELLAIESDLPEDPGKDPESLEGCNKGACEMDDGPDDANEVEEDEDDYISLDSLLDSVFKG
jgi:hypothetical protein